ncbi:microtubule-associated protein 6 isoform X1 [Ambystoma mexicanum]|uniref:microtubule-associated protein 6 isoform X1 n=1 Tax=Ambystoma mexicanum TaxID=8296 RepID=UPI0037E7CABF
MAWPCITRACCVDRYWQQLDKADIAVPLVFARYSEATDAQPLAYHHHQLPVQHGPRATLSAIETQPSLMGGGEPDVAAAGLPTEFASSQGAARSGGGAGSGNAPATPGSVMRQDFKVWRVKPEPSCKPKSEYSPSETPFEKETQYQKDFKAWPTPGRGDHPWIPKPSPAPSTAGDRSTAEAKKKGEAYERKAPEEVKGNERPAAGEKGERAKAEDGDTQMPTKGKGGPHEAKGLEKVAAGERMLSDKDPQMASKGKGGPAESKGAEKAAAGDRAAVEGRDPQMDSKGKGGPVESKGLEKPAAGERNPAGDKDPQMDAKGKSQPTEGKGVEKAAAGERAWADDKEPQILVKGKGGPIESKSPDKPAAGERTAASDKEPMLPSKGKVAISTPGETTEKKTSVVESTTGFHERRGRAVVDALNMQIKEEIGPGTSYRNEFRAWTDVKPVKAIRAQPQYKPPEDKVIHETSYKSTFKGEFNKPAAGDNKLTERRRIRSLYSEPYKEPSKVEKPSVQTSKPKKTTTSHKPLKKAKEKLIVSGRSTKKKSTDSATATKPEDKEKSKEINNKLAEAKEVHMPPRNRTDLVLNEMDLNAPPDATVLLQ